MQEQAFDLDNIIVTADPFGNLAQSRIVYDDVKAITQPRNVSDLFKDIPGFGIIKRGAYASEPVFRAFKYEQLNVQYDGGMKILNACPNRMDPITTHVIPEEIERIEVVKGPFTVRFGQNFGGIINMVSKTPVSRAFCRAIVTLSFFVAPFSTSTSSVPSSINLNTSCDTPTERMVFVTSISIKTSPDETDTVLIETDTVSSRYCF